MGDCQDWLSLWGVPGAVAALSGGALLAGKRALLIRAALLAIDVSRGGRAQAIAEAFQTDRFIATANENYRPIEEVARELGIIRP